MDADPFGRGDDGAVALQASDGTWWVRKSELKGQALEAASFGVSGAKGPDANATALNLAIQSSSVVKLPKNATINVNKVEIKSSCLIKGRGATLNGHEESIFSVESNIESLKVENVNFDFENADETGGGSGSSSARDAITNAENYTGVDSFGLPSKDWNVGKIGRLRVINCNFKFSRLILAGEGDHEIRECSWEGGNIISRPTYVFFADVNDVTFSENRMNVKASDIFDIVKISGNKQTGSSRGVKLRNNIFKNTEPSLRAIEVDVTSGFDRSVVSQNEFIDCFLQRKSGSDLQADQGFDIVSNNQFKITPDFNKARATAITYRGDSFRIDGNMIQILESDSYAYNEMHVIDLVREGVQYDDWNTNRATRFQITNNTVYGPDDPSGVSDAYFINLDRGDENQDAWAIVSNNILMGLRRFAIGFDGQYGAMNGNIWRNRAGAGSAALAGGMPAVGNAFEGGGPLYGIKESRANRKIVGIDTTSTNTLDPKEYPTFYFRLDGNGTIDTISPSFVGQEIILFSNDSPTLAAGFEIKLNGGTDFTFSFRDHVRLIQSENNDWVEMSRT
jgi:hypothetical protein